MIENAIYSRLSTDAGVAALVSTRIYPGRAPQNTTQPYIAYERISTTPEDLVGATAGVTRARVQFMTVADTHDSARGVANAVRESLDRFQGVEATITVLDVFFENELDNNEQDGREFVTIQDFEIIYRD